MRWSETLKKLVRSVTHDNPASHACPVATFFVRVVLKGPKIEVGVLFVEFASNHSLRFSCSFSSSTSMFTDIE